VKATQRDFSSIAPRAARECAVFFFCGPDEAGASAAADRLVAQLADPGERVELTGAELKADPVRLTDEARSASLFGGTRHLFVRAAGEEAHDAVKLFCELADIGETRGACPVLIHATSATDKSRTAKLLDGRRDALVAMFWPPDLASLTAEVRTMAEAAGLRLSVDIAERIARASGLDVRLARSEITKLALYLDASPQTPRLADPESLAAIGAVTEDEGFAPLVNAVLSGELDKLPGEIRRMRELGLNPVAVTLALERRAAQLARIAARTSHGGDSKAALDAERPPFAERRDIAAQVNRWNPAKLDRLIDRLAELHRALLANSAVAELLLAQALVQIARVAGGARSRQAEVFSR
jgi:DNA polymerase-3 subunit delta